MTEGAIDMSTTQESAPERLDEEPGVVDRMRRLRGPLVVLLVAVLLVAAGGWFLAQSLYVRHTGSATNQAVVDTTATNHVIGDVSAGLNRIFSYSYTDTGATRHAAASVLTGRAAGQYATLFGQVQHNAAAQKLKLTSRVVTAGVTRLDGDHAQLLVFLDQSSTRGDSGTTSTAAAQLSITAQLVAGHWKIADIHAR
jgi:Mce-associated membrane protein